MDVADARDAVHDACLRMVADGLVDRLGRQHQRARRRAPLRRDRGGRAVRRADRRRPPGRRRPHRRVGRTAPADERDRPARRACSGRCPTSAPSSTPTPATRRRSPWPASTCRSSATRAWPRHAERVLVTRTRRPARPTSGPRRWPRSAASRGAGPCCWPTTASSPSARRWPTPSSWPESVEWTAEICHLARTLVAAGTGEHVLDRAVQDAIARNYGVTIAGTDPSRERRRRHRPLRPRADPRRGRLHAPLLALAGRRRAARRDGDRRPPHGRAGGVLPVPPADVRRDLALLPR